MTIQEEINKLTWHNAINKLKSILSKLVSNTPNDIYLTTETLTGGTWIDGKPIYRRVLNIVSDGSADPISLSNLLNTESIVYTGNWYVKINDKYMFAGVIDGQNSNGYNPYVAYGVVNPNEWYLGNNYLFSNGQEYLCVLEYTKTTD